MKAGDTIKVHNQFTRAGEPMVSARVTKVNPPWVWARFYWNGKWRNSKHRIEDVSTG